MFWIISTIIVISLLEVPSLIRERKYKELGVFYLFILIGFILSYIQIKNIDFTRPTEFLVNVVKTYLPWYYDFMEP